MPKELGDWYGEQDYTNVSNIGEFTLNPNLKNIPTHPTCVYNFKAVDAEGNTSDKEIYVNPNGQDVEKYIYSGVSSAIFAVKKLDTK